MVAEIVRTLQVLPEQHPPELYWVVGTKQALTSFPASAMPFADNISATALAEDCPDEPSAEFWTTTTLAWKQVPKKARDQLAKLQQYVMLLNYEQYAHAKLVEREPPKLDPPYGDASCQVQR